MNSKRQTIRRTIILKVRSPLHKAVKMYATLRDKSINEIGESALSRYVGCSILKARGA